MHIAALVLGLCAIVFTLPCFLWGIPGLVCAILAIVFGIIAKKQLVKEGKPTSMATAGLVCGIVGLVEWVIMVILAVTILASLFGMAKDTAIEMNRQIREDMQHQGIDIKIRPDATE